LDLLVVGKTVADLARDVGISEQANYGWRRQERIDQGVESGLSTLDRAELAAAKRRIHELETELAVHRRAAELLKERADPKRRFAAIAVMAAEGLPVQVACRVLGVSESGYYAQRRCAPSARVLRHAWLTDRIRQVHEQSRRTYGARRVRAELVLGQGVVVGHQAVEWLMRAAGIQGVGGRPRYRKTSAQVAATDRVGRQFGREQPDELWGDRHHGAPDARRQGVLRRRARRVLTPGCRVVDRRSALRRASDQRLGDGHRQATTDNVDGDP